jgi:heterodisulfide reductase subunit B
MCYFPDKSQFAPRAHDRNVGIPVLSDAQTPPWPRGAHPFRVVQFHWHSTDWRPLLDKLGVNWQHFWDEFQGDLEAIRSGRKSGITWEDADKPVSFAA